MDQFDNQNWLDKLSANGLERDAALLGLRELLKQRVHRALGTKARVDDAFIEDVVQEGLVAILGALGQFQGRSKFTTWATTITIRIAIAEMRRLRWKDTSLEQLLEKQASVMDRLAVGPGAEIDVHRSQLVEAMHRVINEQLTEKQRTVLQAELQGMPQEEIGRRLGSNRNAIYKLTHDARKRLKQGLVAAGYSVEDLAHCCGESR